MSMTPNDIEDRLDRIEAKLDAVLAGFKGDTVVIRDSLPCLHLLEIDGVCDDCGACMHRRIMNSVCEGCGLKT